jgi:excisionase family DNA binding protein
MTAKRRIARTRGEQNVGCGQIAHRPARDDREPSRPGQVSPRDHFREPLKFFTVAEVAQSLDVSTRSVRRWIENSELAAHRFGRAVRIAECDLEAFLTTHRQG